MTPTGHAPTATVRLTGRVAVHSRNDRSRDQLSQAIARQGYEVLRASTREELQRALDQDAVAACLLDEPESPAFIEAMHAYLRERHKSTQLLMLPALGVRGDALPAGVAIDVIEPPHTPDRIGRALFAAVGRAQLIAENLKLKLDLDGRIWPELIGHSPAMQRVRAELRPAAESDQPVLVRGEAGTGTTFLARAIHTARFADRVPLMTVRCQVLSSAAAESELFGGWSAASPQPGRLQAAAGGMLLLDDVDTLPLSVQSRLATLLASGPTSPPSAGNAAARLIATTHADLQQLANEGGFDRSLLRHLSRHVIILPPLRERREDIAALAEHFLAEFAAREGRPIKQLTVEALERLKAYHWPGNVRELENAISRCCALEHGGLLSAAMIMPWLEEARDSGSDDMGLSLREMERKLIEATFTRFHGNRELTARALKIGLRTLSGKLREYGYPPRGGPGSNREARAA
jgi:DNA-binding NtrC family response regulator